MKYKIKIIILFLLCIISFTRTNKIINSLRTKDPIMKKIKDNDFKYNIKSEEAKIQDNYIIPGLKGKTIDYEKTYTNMKKYGKYNELLMVFKEIEPNITIKGRYDKYISRGNPQKRNISIIINSNNFSPKEIAKSLMNNNSLSVSFNEEYLSKNYHDIKKYLNEYNILLEDPTSSNNISYMKTLLDDKNIYCYATKENNDVLKKCLNEKTYTIIPQMAIQKDYFHTIKSKVSNGYILSLELNKELEKELQTILKYLKNKGYNIVTIDKLLQE